MRPTVTLQSGELKAPPSVRRTLRLSPHAIEREVHRRLSSHPGLRLQSLVVHKTPAGVCLEGRAELLGPDLDLTTFLRDIDGVEEVINRLMPAGPCLTSSASEALDDADELILGYHQG